MTGTGNLLQRAIPRLYLAASGTVTNDSVSDVLDSAQEVTKDTANEVNQFVQYFYDHIPNLIAFGMKVLFAIIFFLIGRKVIKWIRKIVSRSMERANADVGVKQFVDSMLKFVMYAVLIFLIATKFGVESSSVAALIASAGVAIGLAVQGSLSNFARMTTIDNKTIIVPNGILTDNSLTNVTARPERQLDLKVGIAYDADLKKAKGLIETMLLNDKDVIQDEEIKVFVDELADSSVVIGLRAWVKTEAYWTTRWRVLEEIKLQFDEAGIEIPFNQLTVHMKEGK